MSSNTVYVSNISPETTEKEVRDFFSFCGKIQDLQLQPASGEPNSPKTAAVTFEREPAAKTALLLDQTKLGKSNVHVHGAPSIDEIAEGKVASHADEPKFGAEDEHYRGDIRQEDKPRAAILAELLGSGYTVADTALQKSIELDKKHGISQRFTNYLNQALQTIESKFHPTDRAKAVEQQYHVTDKFNQARSSVLRYFEQALDTPTGKRVRTFYATAEKQALDIHNEARRLADLKKQQGQQREGVFTEPENTTCPCGGNEGICSCPPGKCTCAGCGKAATGVPVVGTSAGGEPSRQFGGAAQDIKNASQDISTGAGRKA
jgi:RNA recognition motif-containing protein